MKIALFLEGSPGHEKQSWAIVQALKGLIDVDITEFRVPELPSWKRVVEVGLLAVGMNSGPAFNLAGFDLAIGTGSRTHATLIACKRKFGIPIVTCMAPDRLLRGQFDLCCVPRHDQLKEENNILLTDGPPVLSVEQEFARDPGKGLILLGGVDESSHYWRGAELATFVRNIVADSPAINWTISSSPRTPEDTVKLISTFAETADQVQFFNFKDTPRGWVEEQYARSNLVWVTADSISMIYEALTAGSKVGILPVRWKKSENKFQRSIDHLLAKGLVKIYSPADKSSLLSMPEHSFNEAARCAAEIIRRFSLHS